MPMLMTEETGATGATEILKTEHQNIKDLFRKFDETASDRQKKSIGDAAIREIETQACLAVEVFYPAVRRQVGERQRIVQAKASHEVARLLIKELKGLSAGEQYNARFDLLKSSVTQQMDEEEAELIPRVEKSDLDLELLGKEMFQMKSRITQNDKKAFLRKTGAITLGVVAAAGVVAWLVSGKSPFKNKDRD